MTSDGMLIKEPLIKRGEVAQGNKVKSFLDGGCCKTAKKDKRNAVDRPEGLSEQTSFCKRCSKPGHNSSTCTVLELEVFKRSHAGRTKCSNCGGTGHNSATCTAGVEVQDD
ncbi:hypothetical protein QYE76_001513 [Lolium multiflorum]|uniref:CCHC-type domain-containing protein n=1 Tax=Lolium multiflorum TaxID=4521 RepID=A0AAD8VZF5_LOLMU|nr:hypothetical protein QYE76_001513 [Lolium multiflorum]